MSEKVGRAVWIQLISLEALISPFFPAVLSKVRTLDKRDRKIKANIDSCLNRIFYYPDHPKVFLSLITVGCLARKCLENDRFKKWFPRKDNRRGRQGDEFKEFLPWPIDRLKNSPLFYMRRRLNGKAGKEYGEINRKYKENFMIDT